MKPGRKGAPLADRSRQAGQAEKDGLEDVLGVVGVPDAPACGPQDHRAVAGDQQFKSLAVVGRGDALQQPGIVRRQRLIARQAQVPLQLLDRPNGHAHYSSGGFEPA